MSNIFCLWSGGIDSTYLLNSLLKEGHYITAAFINLDNNTEQMIREDKARENMLPYFKLRYPDTFNYYGRASTVSVSMINDKIPLRQVIPWLFSYVSIPNYSYRVTEKVALGYVMNDDAISHIDELKGIWNAFNKFADDKVELVFPLIKKKKADIWSELPIELSQHCTWCEGDGVYDNCGVCHSCERVAYEIPGLSGKFNPKPDVIIREEFSLTMGDGSDQTSWWHGFPY